MTGNVKYGINTHTIYMVTNQYNKNNVNIFWFVKFWYKHTSYQKIP